MPWSNEEGEEQLTMQRAVEAQMRRGPTGPLPPIEEVNLQRKRRGLDPISQAQYNEEVERRNRARAAS